MEVESRDRDKYRRAFKSGGLEAKVQSPGGSSDGYSNDGDGSGEIINKARRSPSSAMGVLRAAIS